MQVLFAVAFVEIAFAVAIRAGVVGVGAGGIGRVPEKE
jgi:hypothetical protein